MNFFAVFLRKLEPSAKLERTLPPFLGKFRIENGRRWRFLGHSIVRYSRLSRLQRCGTPILEKRSCASQRKRTPITGKL